MARSRLEFAIQDHSPSWLLDQVGRSLGTGLFAVADDGSVWLSPRAAALLGVDAAPETTTAIVGAILDEDRPAFEALLRDARHGEVELEIRTAAGGCDGPLIYVTAGPSGAPEGGPAVFGAMREAVDGRFVTEALRRVVEGTASRFGEDFFRTLVLNLADACGTRWAFLAKFTDASRARVRTFAAVADGQIVPDVEYDLAGTPCERAASKGVCLHLRNVRALYPQDILLQEMGAESYLGVPLHTSGGDTLGILIVLHDRPLSRGQDVRTILSIFAARVTAELERLAADRARMALEARVRRAEKLESLGLLAGGIAHDFANHLQAIGANVELVELGIERGTDVGLYLAGSFRALEQAGELTRQLLDYAGKGSRAPREVHVDRLVEESAQLFRVAVPRTAALRVDTTPGLPAIVADPSQIQQVVLNLVTNAADALEGRSGHVTLRVRLRHLEAPALGGMILGAEALPGDHVVVEVEDDGCGMDEATLARIFDPFFTTKPNGRGLGLCSMIGILKAQHGALDVHSERGHGTSFRVYFPVRAAA